MADDVSAPLPDLTLTPGTTVTVYSGDSSVPVLSLAVKVFQVTPEPPRQASRPLLLRGGR